MTDESSLEHERYCAALPVVMKRKAHSNTAESWNARFKRAINGVWHWISIKHLDRYCTETAFRWNHRGHDGCLAAMVTGCVGRVSWKALTA
jgi:hypothetical protein